MCLGVPGQVVEFCGDRPELVQVDVRGRRRPVNVLPLGDCSLAPGDWVLVYLDLAVEKLEEAEARDALAFLENIS